MLRHPPLAAGYFVDKQGIGQDKVVVAGGASGSDAVKSVLVRSMLFWQS
jgi:hypothetical protein